MDQVGHRGLVSVLRTISAMIVVGALATSGVGGAQPRLTEAARPLQASLASFDRGTKSDCLYAGPYISSLNAFSAASGHDFACAMVFNNAVTTWGGWDTPWFEQDPSANLNWANWKAARPDRQLIITEDMVPGNPPADWRAQGAAGQYDAYAQTLAANLVAHGLGNSVIRLGHEGNYNQEVASVGTTPTDYANWVQYWRNIVVTMRSVPGAHFLFDWNILGGYRDIPFASIYPGSDVVDIISIDQYDGTIASTSGLTSGQHWDTIWNQASGLGALMAFAQAQGKPTAFPEWSLEPGGDSHGFGDDPDYINNMAALVSSQNVAYQSYWDVQGTWNILQAAPSSWQAYLSHFGGGGDSQGQPLNLGSMSTGSAGLWVISSQGAVQADGSATSFGDLQGRVLNKPVIAAVSTADKRGYWLLGADGGVFSFGDARFYGSMGGRALNAPMVGIAATPTGRGYWLIGADGGVFSFGDARFFGSTGSLRLNRPVVDAMTSPTGAGYLLVAADGGTFAFGDSHFFGSTAAMRLNRPIVSGAMVTSGAGYWLIGADGGIFSFGPGAVFAGSLVSIAPGDTGSRIRTGPYGGYYLLDSSGHVFAVGGAPAVAAPGLAGAVDLVTSDG